MIRQHEMSNALAVALAASAPIGTPQVELQGIFLDFVGPHTLRLIGTNRQCMTVVSVEFTHYQPEGTRISLTAMAVNEILEAFPVDRYGEFRLTVCLFDGQLIISDGAKSVTVPDAKRKMPDYVAAMTPKGERVPEGWYDLAYFHEALKSVRRICDGTVSVELHGPTAPLFLRPVLYLTLKHIKAVDIAIMPRRQSLDAKPVQRVEEDAGC